MHAALSKTPTARPATTICTICAKTGKSRVCDFKLYSIAPYPHIWKHGWELPHANRCITPQQEAHCTVAGEKLIDHLKKWLDTTKLLETPHSWEPGQESDIAAAILETQAVGSPCVAACCVLGCVKPTLFFCRDLAGCQVFWTHRG